MIKNSLLIGCGNIGGEYDLECEEFLTHSKTINNCSWIENKYAYDTNKKKLHNIISNYNFKNEKAPNKKIIKKYNLICIASPTDSHYKYLNLCLDSNSEFILCEKPISNSVQEIDNLIKKYSQSKSFVLINYFRRFQSGYKIIRNKIHELNIKPKSVKILYNKGILNNATHALDLFQYITNYKIEPSQVKIIKKEFDYFKKDPTISAKFNSNGILIELIGYNLSNKKFEMDISFDGYDLQVRNRGDLVYFFKKNKLIHKWDNLIYNYMIDVYEFLRNIISNKSETL